MVDRTLERRDIEKEKRSTHRRLFALARAAEVQVCAEDFVRALADRKDASQLEALLGELKYFSEELQHETKAYVDSLTAS